MENCPLTEFQYPNQKVLMMNPTQFVEQVKSLLEPLANADDARAMSAYLRGQFVCLGIHTPVRRSTLAEIYKLRFDNTALLQIAEKLWQQPCREYRYVAIDLLARHKKTLDLDCIPSLLELAQREAWWETVDGLADVIGDVIRLARPQNPQAQTLMDAALADSNLWVRRIAMTHQLGWRLETDQQRLFDYATALANEEDFFIRKAIGWALRDYARWRPATVFDFVSVRRNMLSTLTVKEALKHFPPSS